jgi:ketosteroid isomerase-like protein
VGVAENKALVLRFFELRNRDPAAARPLVAEDATWTIPGSLPMSGIYRGREAIFRDYLGRHSDDFETITSEITRTIAEGDTVVVEYHARGRTRRGRDYDTTYYYVVDLRDGRIQSVRQSLDTLYTRQTLYD